MITIEQRVPGLYSFVAKWEKARKVRVRLELTDTDGDVDTREIIWSPLVDIPLREAIEALVELIDNEPHWRANIVFNELRIGPSNAQNVGVATVEFV